MMAAAQQSVMQQATELQVRPGMGIHPLTLPESHESRNHSDQCSHSNQLQAQPPHFTGDVGRTQDLAKLAAKLCKVMQACAVVPKDKQNPQQHYKYASSDAVLEKANPAFVAAGLATIYELEVLDRQLRTTSSGAVWELVTVRARLTIIDGETGATIQTDGIGQGYDPSDKAFSKAQTQARKYALLLGLNISTGDDPEGDAATDKAQIPPVPCSRCKGPAAHIKDETFEGKPVKVYYCEKCRKETRKPA